MKRISLVILGWLVLTSAHAASFDCAKATSNIERLICSNDELSKLDETLTKSYQQAIEQSVNKSAVIKEQRQWLKKVRNPCQDAGCLKIAYQERINKIEIASAVANADSGLDVPELRYTCKQNQGIDIHLSKYAETAEVNEVWSGEPVPYERTFSVQNGDPKQGNPLLLKCALWSGTYTVRIEATLCYMGTEHHC